MVVMASEYLTIPEVAGLLKVHPETVRVWLRNGVLRGVQLPNGWRVPDDALAEFLQLRMKGGDGA